MTANTKECFQRPQLKISLASVFGFLGGALLSAGLTYYIFWRRLDQTQSYPTHTIPSGSSFSNASIGGGEMSDKL